MVVFWKWSTANIDRVIALAAVEFGLGSRLIKIILGRLDRRVAEDVVNKIDPEGGNDLQLFGDLIIIHHLIYTPIPGELGYLTAQLRQAGIEPDISFTNAQVLTSYFGIRNPIDVAKHIIENYKEVKKDENYLRSVNTEHEKILTSQHDSVQTNNDADASPMQLTESQLGIKPLRDGEIDFSLWTPVPGKTEIRRRFVFKIDGKLNVVHFIVIASESNFEEAFDKVFLFWVVWEPLLFDEDFDCNIKVYNRSEVLLIETTAELKNTDGQFNTIICGDSMTVNSIIKSLSQDDDLIFRFYLGSQIFIQLVAPGEGMFKEANEEGGIKWGL